MARFSPDVPTGSQVTLAGSSGSSDGSPRPPSLTMTRLNSLASAMPPSARVSAAGQSALPRPGCASLMAVCRASRSLLAAASSCGCSATRMSVSRSLAARADTTAWASCCAARKRVPAATSPAFMLAEASSSSTIWPLPRAGTVMKGRASAKTSAARISSCSSSNRLRRRRCQGVLASVSCSSCCHSMMLETSISWRRRRSM